MTGSRFANTSPLTLLRFLGAALGSFTVSMTIATLSVLVLIMLLAVPVADAVVAFADAPPVDAAVVGIVEGHQAREFRRKS